MTRTNHETKVFIAGSRHLSKLSQEVKQRLDNIIERKLAVVIGDANGVDKAVQQYLSDKAYSNVVVFCMNGSCRNNIGDWPTHEVKAAKPTRRDFAYYSTKDRAMASEADYGFMLWDGESRGKVTSIVRLVKEAKPVVVFLAPDKAFYTLREVGDLEKVQIREADIERIDRELQVLGSSSASSRKDHLAPVLF